MNWAIPLIEKDDPLLYNLARFKNTMRKLFAKHVFIQASDNELLNLRQGNKDLISYITSFNRLVTETQWPEEKRTSLFYRGLRDDLKDSLSHFIDLPDDCSEFIDLVVKLDHRLSERRGERSRGDTKLLIIKPEKRESDKSEPMQIGGMRGPLSSEEKDRRRKGNLCLYCGKPGHYAKECPGKPKSSPKKIALVENQPSEN